MTACLKCPTCGTVREAADLVTMTMPQFRRQECVVDGRIVNLSPLQTELLSILLIRRGAYSTYSLLIELAYPDYEPDWAHNSLRVTLYHLRAKIPGLIFTKTNFGVILGDPA
jgi:DNA-binding response OmpR family regulator